MFNKTSGLVFCQTAFELPLWDLFEASQLTVAIAQTRRFVRLPDRGDDTMEAFGVVHLSGGMHSDGAISPSLPCEISFDSGLSHDDEGSLIRGCVNLYTEGEDRHYRLSLGVKDKAGSIFAKIEAAVRDAALTKRRFLHLTLDRGKGLFARGEPNIDMFAAARDGLAKRNALAQRVEEQAEALPDLEFHTFWFNHNVTTEAPLWTFAWKDADSLTGPVFQERQVARMRQKKRWPPPRQESV